jgi:hypothetical protein
MPPRRDRASFGCGQYTNRRDPEGRAGVVVAVGRVAAIGCGEHNWLDYWTGPVYGRGTSSTAASARPPSPTRLHLELFRLAERIAPRAAIVRKKGEPRLTA